MKTLRLCTFGLALTLLTGCYYMHAYNPDGEWGVRYSSSVNVVRYNVGNYPIPAHTQMFDRFNPPPTNYLVLANLSRDGWRRDEGMIMGALLWRARQLGANGLINVGESSGDAIPDFAVGGKQGVFGVAYQGSKPLFRGIAILYTNAP